jgi:hypothetical protein
MEDVGMDHQNRMCVPGHNYVETETCDHATVQVLTCETCGDVSVGWHARRSVSPPDVAMEDGIESPAFPYDPEATVLNVHDPRVVGFDQENDVPLVVRRELLRAATAAGISYYWLCAIYRKGRTDV